MKNILLASHGYLAKGLKNTLSIFSQDADRIEVICAYVDESNNYIEDIKKFIENSPENDSIIFTDIYGGSVNTKIVEEMVNSKKNIPIISGMNLPLVLSVLIEDDISKDRISEIIGECCPCVVEIPKESIEVISKGDEEDDFLE